MKKFFVAVFMSVFIGQAAVAEPGVSDRGEAVVIKAAASADAASLSRAPLRVRSVKVSVPRSLKVSESSQLLPSGDIVWREDPKGDRYAQVQAIFETAMKRGVAPLKGSIPVDISVEVVKFHALTETARRSTGGVHALKFMLTVTDARTGKVLMERHAVQADFEAYGGRKAKAAEAQGQTQKVRITNHLAQVIAIELSNPEGYTGSLKSTIQRWNYM
ncbi:DUF6778 family protein [Albibacillus kandeliae]|uniref:DUF6778 family protein n=1 Tax=Albibacillus kandeliae TaxID=2174228 RepID=UPI000D68BBC7|nr:DUF6778 family protein [Albibacillus kandeliae]